MKKASFWVGVCALVFLLAACSPTEKSAPTPTAQEQPPTAAPSPTLEVVQVDHCLDCHTDKDRLIDTAKPEEVEESESEGVG